MTRRRLEYARRYAEKVVDYLTPWSARAEIAGSIRRGRPEVKDIEIVAVPIRVPDGLFVTDTRLACAEIHEQVAKIGQVVKGGEKYIQVAEVFGSGLALDLFLVTPPAEWGPIFTIRTGPASFSEMLVTRIKGRLWRCSEGRVTDDQGRHVPCPTEEDFFRAAQVPFLAPEDRA